MWWGPIYDPKPLHEKIREITGDLRLDQTLTKILVPVFDVRRLFPRAFSSYKAHGEHLEEAIRPKLSDVSASARQLRRPTSRRTNSKNS